MLQTVLLLTLAAAPTPQGKVRFGDAGTWSPSGSLSFSHQRYDAGGAGTFARNELVLAPRLDYFVVDNLSVGVGLLASVEWRGDLKNNAVGMSLGAGYNLWIAKRVSLDPQLDLAFVHTWTSGENYDAISQQTLNLVARLPLLVHFDHLYLGMGPTVRQRLFTRDDLLGATYPTTNVRFSMFVGGWID